MSRLIQQNKHPVGCEYYRFNWREDKKEPIGWCSELVDLPECVKPVGYMDVVKIINTSGCSNTPELWSWNYIGQVDTGRGKILIYPGEFLVSYGDGVRFVMTEDELLKTAYLHRRKPC